MQFSLPDSFRISQEHAKQLEEKLNASEIARTQAEAKARAAEDLQAKLEAAEEALKEAQDKATAMKNKIDQIDAREADAQSKKFGGNSLLSMVRYYRTRGRDERWYRSCELTLCLCNSPAVPRAVVPPGR